MLLPRVGARAEVKVWSQGVRNWNDFISLSKINGFSRSRKNFCDWRLQHAKKALRDEDVNFFGNALPQGEHWRLFKQFKDDACYLDIETSGYYGNVTVVGISDGVDTFTFVRGFNLEKDSIEKVINKYKVMLTFNGASFDLPVMRRYFNMDFKIPHIDLRFAAQKIGLSGGLKSIEKQINITRREEVADMGGDDAPYLWEMWKSTGKREYLDKLVMYNEEDILNLKPLANYVIPKLWSKVRSH